MKIADATVLLLAAAILFFTLGGAWAGQLLNTFLNSFH